MVKIDQLRKQEESKMHPAVVDGHHFLQHCLSKPITLRDLKVGEKFIFFPYDGDDDGHGGFKGGARLFEKIEPYRPNDPIYHDDYRLVAKEVERQLEVSGNLDMLVFRIVGV